MKAQKAVLWIVFPVIAVSIALAVFFSMNSEAPTVPESWPKLEDIRENYSPKQAKLDGCVVIDNSDLISGEKIWVDFVNQTRRGNQAVVRIYQSYSKQNDGYTVKDLRYDGKKYLLRFYDLTGDTGEEFLFEEEYLYMNRSLYSWNAQTVNRVESYLLADSPDANAQGYMDSLVSSVFRPENDVYAHGHTIYSCAVDSEYVKQTVYGTAFADIDDDGTEEKCCLGLGRTSGIFTFTLTVYEEDRLEYDNCYRTEFYYLSFVQAENGKLQVQGITQGNSPETHLFDLVLTDDSISLVEGGMEIRPLHLDTDE